MLEHIEGDGLSLRLQQGALPWKKALRLGLQVAEALAAAHETGVIHRDLKPGNIMIAAGGLAKVLDFGIAKSTSSENTDDQTSLTRTGRAVGTPAYMSPEQLRGEPVDRRCDVWAFGCVLYEMLTGQTPFKAKTAADAVTCVLATDPDWQKLPAAVPANIRTLLRRCLEKEADRRLQHLADAALEIRETLDAPDSIPPDGVAASSKWSTWRVAAACCLIGIGLGLFGAGIALRDHAAPRVRQTRPARMVIRLPDEQKIAPSRSMPLGIAQRAVALAPDGSCLVYTAQLGDRTQLFVRPIDELKARLIPGTEEGFGPFFSPDSRSVGFFTKDKLKTVSLLGGEPVTLCDAPNPRGAHWGDDGMIYIGDTEGLRFSRISAIGGHREELTGTADDDRDVYLAYSFPQLLPGGKSVLITSRSGAAAFALDTRTSYLLVEGGAGARYVPTGHLLYAQAGALRAVRFDPETLKMSGPAVPVLDGLASDSRHGMAQYAVSSAGLLAYVPGGDTANSIRTWVDRSGKTDPLPLPPDVYGEPDLSPDGRFLAINLGHRQSPRIGLFEIGTGRRARMILEGPNWFPEWTPDGKRIAFSSAFEGQKNRGIFWAAVDGSSGAELLHSSQYSVYPISWSPDGKRLVFTQYRPDTRTDIWMLSLEGSRSAEAIVATEKNEMLPTFSPDGRYIAYASDRDGKYQVYVQPYPAMDKIWQVSDGFGEEAIWSAKGDELFYRNGDQWMVVRVSTEPDFSAGVPGVLFEGPYINVPGFSYDVDIDARRFLVLQPQYDDSQAIELHVVLNWFEELERLVPAKAGQ